MDIRSSNPTTSLLPLNENTLHYLKELLAEECREWMTRLFWDYAESAEIILQVAGSGGLPGFILVNENSLPIGYCFWIQEGRRVLIGDVYVLAGVRGKGIDVDLIETMLKEIGRNGIEKIESQNIGFGLNGAESVYQKNGFISYNRHFMLKKIDNDISAAKGVSDGRFLTDDRWFVARAYHSNDFTQVIRLIYESYVGQSDSKINSQYSTHSGCKEFFGNLISNTGCGKFLRNFSLVVEEEISRRIVGIVITTEISPTNAHLPQISVLPQFQGLGIGRQMIDTVSNRLFRNGYRTTSLAVSAINETAVKLYVSRGFETILEFPVFSRTF